MPYDAPRYTHDYPFSTFPSAQHSFTFALPSHQQYPVLVDHESASRRSRSSDIALVQTLLRPGVASTTDWWDLISSCIPAGRLNIATIRHPRHDDLPNILPKHHHAVHQVVRAWVATWEEAVELVLSAAYYSEVSVSVS